MQKTIEETDVLIIGSGAAGAPVALKLAQAGHKVIVLEKGDWLDRQDNPEDEFAELQMERHRPEAGVDPTIVFSEGQKISGATRVGQSFYLVGGGTVRYTATSWRLRPDDFKKKTKYGDVAGASIVDWPLGYDDLEPYYTEAERIIGISGVSGVDPTEPKRSKNYLMPPLAPDRFQDMLSAAAKKLGWQPFVIPIAIHSEASSERGAGRCMQCGWCAGFPCRYFAKSSVDVTVFPIAKKLKKFELRTNAYATEILLDTKNKRSVQAVHYINLKTKQVHAIKPRILILAAGGIQTPRILLQNQLANSSGLLGKNLMFHVEALCSADFEKESFHEAYYKKIAVHDFYYPSKGEAFTNHRSIQTNSKAPPISFAMGTKGFGKSFINQVNETFLSTQAMQCVVEDLPQENNRIVLNDSKKDPWGFAIPEVHHVYHPHDRSATSSALAKMKMLLEAAGGKKVKTGEPPKNITDGYTYHLMGTARMGKDPATSVVNTDSQCHDIENLFITDSSVFATAGGLNPTLTIQALSLRAADRIQNLIKAGKV